MTAYLCLACRLWLPGLLICVRIARPKFQTGSEITVRTRSTTFRIALAGFTALLLALLSFSSGFVVAAIQPNAADFADDGAPAVFGADAALLGVFTEAWDLIEKDFFGPLPSSTERAYGAIRGILEEVDDPYTVFVEPIPHKFDQEKLRGSYGGIGVDLSRNAEGDVLLSPFRASPASRAGIAEGDVLVAVDGVGITDDMDISQDIAALLRGDVGTEAMLSTRRGQREMEFIITREIIETPSVEWMLLEQAPTLAYLKITSFTDRTPIELVEGLEELIDVGGAKGLVLDLRNNGGGLLHSSIDVADQFLDSEVVLYEIKKGNVEKAFTVHSGGRALDIPLVVLVNRGTASASEIVAGAIQDHDRGLLVGEATFGKGSVQLIFDLSDGASLHITAAQWLTPGRHQLDGVGLTPDVVMEEGSDGGDLALEKAVDLLESESR